MTSEPSGARILVVEDEVLALMMLESLLADSGYTVVGPAGTVMKALTLIEAEPIDGALLDVNLGGELVYPVADALAARSVPFAFVTGYGIIGIDAGRYAGVPVVQKPYDDDALLRLIATGILGHKVKR
jgi:CheY-like chemotaxis protein